MPLSLHPSVKKYVHYVPPLFLGLAAIWLFVAGGVACSLILLVGILGSFFSTHFLLGEIRRVAAQKKNLDRQLIQSQKLASIGELSAGIAHEINNPLAIIGQEVEWVRVLMEGEEIRHFSKFGELADSLREITHQVDRCKEITHKLLDFARKKEPLIQSVDMNRLIEDMARLVDKEAVQKEIQIIRKYGKDLPLVHTDAPLMRQVVLNLLNNAAFAIGERGTITVETGQTGDDAVEIVVRDNGCGIPSEHLAKIFDPFFTTKPQGKGTGLGLSICHGIVSRLGGRIDVTSEVGKGTNFTVRLPIAARKGDHRE